MDVGAAIRQQMLSVLIDAIGKPGGSIPAGPASGVSPPNPVTSTGARPGGLSPGMAIPLPPLQPGAEVFARVIDTNPAGDATIAIGDRVVTARIAGQSLPEMARQPGATLLLKVETAGETPRFTLLHVDPARPPHASQARMPFRGCRSGRRSRRTGPDRQTPRECSRPRSSTRPRLHALTRFG